MKNANFNLNSVSLLCEFSASVWTARKLDRKKSDEVVTGANAQSKGAARVNKNLLAGRPELEEIAALVTEARTYVYDNTLPWSNSGQRLIMTKRMPKFDKRVRDFEDAFNEKVDAFVQLYPSLITAQAMALGNMFDRNEYPTASTIKSKFAMSCEYLPVPASGDIRVDIGNQALDELRERLEYTSQQRVKAAMAEVNEKLVTHLKRMADRLVTVTDDKTGEPKAQKFTETLVSGAFELCDLIQDYNITGDPLLMQARKVLEEKLSGVTVMTLREDPVKREDVRVAVSNILSKFQI